MYMQADAGVCPADYWAKHKIYRCYSNNTATDLELQMGEVFGGNSEMFCPYTVELQWLEH